VRPHNGGLATAHRAPSGVQRQSPWPEGQGEQNPPEAETLLVFKHLIEGANLPTFPKN